MSKKDLKVLSYVGIVLLFLAMPAIIVSPVLPTGFYALYVFALVVNFLTLLIATLRKEP